MRSLLIDLRELTSKRLKIRHPFVALITRLGDQYKQHLRLDRIVLAAFGLLRHFERLVVQDHHQMEVALLVHRSEAVYARQWNHWCEHLFHFVYRVDERS